MDETAAMSILQAAQAAHPLEACGLLLGTGTRITLATVAANVAPDPARHFEIDPAHLLHWQRRTRTDGQRIIGCWHSHPDGSATPSAADRAGAEGLDLLWLIAAGGHLRLWRVDGPGFAPVGLVRCAPPL